MTDWSATVRELGPGGYAAYAASRAAALIPGLAFHRYLLIAVPRSGMPSLPRGYSIVELDEAALTTHAADLDLPLRAIRHRMDQRMTCLAAMRADRLVGVNFVTAGGFDEDEVKVTFLPPTGAAWDTGLYVHPEHRGSRAFAALWAGTASWLSANGLEWSMSRIAHYNLPSISSHRRMGAGPVGQLNALRFGRYQWLFGTDAVVRLVLP